MFLSVSVLLSLLVVFGYVQGQNDQCLRGFPSSSDVTSNNCPSMCNFEGPSRNQPQLRIFPNMMITCNGLLSRVIVVAAVDVRGGSSYVYPELQIWRPTFSGSTTYNQVVMYPMPMSSHSLMATATSGVTVLEFHPPQAIRVADGDIIGIILSRNQHNQAEFRIYFSTELSTPNYILSPSSSVTFTIPSPSSSDNRQPLIYLDIIPDPVPETPAMGANITMAIVTTIPTDVQTESAVTNEPSTSPPVTDMPLITGGETSSNAAESTELTTHTTGTTDTPPIDTMTTGATTLSSGTATTTSKEKVVTAPPRIPDAAEDIRTTTPEDILTEPTTSPLSSTIARGKPGDGNTKAKPETDSTAGDEAETSSSPLQTTTIGVGVVDNQSSGIAAGVTIGGIIAVLLVVLIVVLIILYVAWSRRSNTGSRVTKTTNNSIQLHNMTYSDSSELHIPLTANFRANERISVMNSDNYDYANVDTSSLHGEYYNVQTRTTTAQSNLNGNEANSNYYLASGTDSTYDVPIATSVKGVSGIASGGRYEWGLVVPSQKQRTKALSLKSQTSSNTEDEAIYAVIGMSQYGSGGPAPKFFEECETYWAPSSNANELYEQLAVKKYREIPRPQIQLTEFLGSGAFGTVNKGLWQSPAGAMSVAIKTMQETDEGEKVKFLQEAAIMGQFRHPNVVKLMGVVTVGEPVMIILEFLSNGDLLHFLIKHRPVPGEMVNSGTSKLLLKFCQQVCSGMEYLARKAFVHRDLAARNILVADDKTCKISDFGMSRDLMDENYYVSHGGKVPVKWTAPEAINYKKYSTASDVWSFGCVMYEIWSLGHKPFEGYTNPETIRKVDKGFRLLPPPGCPREVYKFMIECWHPEYSRRPSFALLVEMLSQADFELLLWRDEDTRIHPQVLVVGAPLEAGENLYRDLQQMYCQ